MKRKVNSKNFFRRKLSTILIICLIFTLITIPSTKAFASNEIVKLGDSDNPPEITVEYVGTNPSYSVVGKEIEVVYKITAEKFKYSIPDKQKDIMLVLDASKSMEWCSDSVEANSTDHDHKHNGGTCNLVSMCLDSENLGQCSQHSGKMLPHNVEGDVCNNKIENYCLTHKTNEDHNTICYASIDNVCIHNKTQNHEVKCEEERVSYCDIHDTTEVHNEVISVCNASRIDMTKYAAINFINKLSEIDNLNIGLITYDNKAVVVEPIEISKKIENEIDINLQNRQTLIENIKDIKLQSGTNIGEALRKTAAILGDENNTDINRSLILITDGAPNKFSAKDNKGSEYYTDINLTDPQYTKGNQTNGNSNTALGYAKTIGEIISKNKYNNIYSVGYAVGDSTATANENLQQIHSSMGASNNTFYTTQGEAIDDLFNQIASDLSINYKFDAKIETSINTNFQCVDNVATIGDKQVITIPQINYVLKEGTIDEYLPNGKEQEVIELKFKVKPTEAGEYDLFENAKISYVDVKGNLQEVAIKGPKINVEEVPSIPDIDAILTSDKVVTVEPSGNVDVNYTIAANDFEYYLKDTSKNKDVVILVDVSSDMARLKDTILAGVQNELINGFLNNGWKVRYNFVTYGDTVEQITVDTNKNDYRWEVQQQWQKIVNNISNNSNSEKKLGEALEKADEIFNNSENDEFEKNIIIISAGDPTDDFPKDIEKGKYNILTLAINHNEYKIPNSPSEEKDPDKGYKTEHKKLYEWHEQLGGDYYSYFVSRNSSTDGNGDIWGIANAAKDHPIVDKSMHIMQAIAEKLKDHYWRSYTINDVKLYFDLNNNFDIVSGELNQKSGDNYYINVPQIRFTAKEVVDSVKGIYRFEAEPIEDIKFTIKPKADKKDVLKFGSNEGDVLSNYISYTMLNGKFICKPIETPTIIVNSNKVVIQVKDDLGELPDKYDTSQSGILTGQYLRNNVVSDFEKNFVLFGQAEATIKLYGKDMNYFKYKIITNNTAITDDSWDDEVNYSQYIVNLPQQQGTYYIAYEAGKKNNDSYEPIYNGVYGPFVIPERFDLKREAEYKGDGYYDLTYNISPKEIDFTDLYRSKEELDEILNSQQGIQGFDITNINLYDVIPTQFKIMKELEVDGKTSLESAINESNLSVLNSKINWDVNLTLNSEGDATDWKYIAPTKVIKLSLKTDIANATNVALEENVAKINFSDLAVVNDKEIVKTEYFNAINVNIPNSSVIYDQGLFNGVDSLITSSKTMSTIDVVDDSNNKPIYTMGTIIKVNSKNPTFRIVLPTGATIEDTAYIYEVNANGKIIEETKKAVFNYTEDMKVNISNYNKNSTNNERVTLEKDKEYMVVYKIRLSNVNEDGVSTHIRSSIDRDIENLLNFRKAELPDLF